MCTFLFENGWKMINMQLQSFGVFGIWVNAYITWVQPKHAQNPTTILASDDEIFQNNGKVPDALSVRIMRLFSFSCIDSNCAERMSSECKVHQSSILDTIQRSDLRNDCCSFSFFFAREERELPLLFLCQIRWSDWQLTQPSLCAQSFVTLSKALSLVICWHYRVQAC